MRMSLIIVEGASIDWLCFTVPPCGCWATITALGKGSAHSQAVDYANRKKNKQIIVTPPCQKKPLKNQHVIIATTTSKHYCTLKATYMETKSLNGDVVPRWMLDTDYDESV